MSLRLLIDEDTEARLLVRFLRSAGHDVETATEAGLRHQPDDLVLAHARQHRRVLLTHNCEHFRELHGKDPSHFGILAVFEDRDRSKNVSDAEIASSVGNLDASSIPLAGEFIPLNPWNY